jgi:hypothetical protein
MYSLIFSRMRTMDLIAPLCTCARTASKMTQGALKHCYISVEKPSHAKDKILHRARRRKKRKAERTDYAIAVRHEGSEKETGP